MEATRTRSRRRRGKTTRLAIEPLAERVVPSANPSLMPGPSLELMHPNYDILNTSIGSGSGQYYQFGDSAAPDGDPTPPSTAFTPDQLKKAYGIDKITFGSVKGDGAGQTVAIVDAYDNPDAADDLKKFSSQFGLPTPDFKKVNQTGGSTPPTADAGWSYEIALDIESVHALAPKASILLVEANSNSGSDLNAAVDYAKSVAKVSVVTMSYGGGEYSSESSDDGTYASLSGHPVTFLASTGDTAAELENPAVSPNVVAVGGSSLYVDSNGNYSSETAWDWGNGEGTGGGISFYEAQPGYQIGAGTPSSSFRTVPDVAFDADPNTGFPVCEEYNGGTTDCWYQFGGTSLASPCMAAVIAIANQGRAKAGEAPLDGRADTLPKLYAAAAADFHDVTVDPGGLVDAGSGYDTSTGRGTPVGQAFINALIGGNAAGGPVTFVNSKTATYTDQDGDLVKVAFTKPILTPANVTSILVTTASGIGVQLQAIDLANLTAAAGTGITVTAKATGTGDGRAAVGLIDATGIDLGKVSIAGDLGKILAGDATATTAGLAGLSVTSIGAFGTDSQAGGGDLSSAVTGGVKSLTVSAELSRGASFVVAGSVGTLKVGGGLDGAVVVQGSLGSGKIAGDLPGFLEVDGDTASLAIGGSVLGTYNLGHVLVKGNVSTLTVGGSLVGGSTAFSGFVEVDGTTKSATVGRDIDGGAATANGQSLIYAGSLALGGHAGKVTVKGSIIGGTANGFIGDTITGTGSITGNADIGSVTVNGNVTGRDQPALITANHPASPTGTKDLAIGSLTVKGNVTDADLLAGFDWNGIPTDGSAQIGKVSIGGDFIQSNLLAGVDLTGTAIGTKANSNAVSTIGSVSVGGMVVGSSNAGVTYRISAADIGTMKIGKSAIGLTAGADNDSLALGFYSNMKLVEV